ncbi:fimbrial outer membrane usher protein TcfC [Serratia quinivorans]|uniref:fimbrial outer membrane usher protein TcfC n=1 Tax=Serratia quinivorans TaxID=137545 RepID=UPI003981EA16
MNTRYRPLYLPLLLACQATAAPQVPPGFESLLLGQTEQLEVRLPGHSLGLFAVEVKPDTLTFEAPEALLAASGLQTLPEAQKQQALQALSQPLLRHGNLACNGSQTPGCGYVATDSAAAILDESQGAVLLFLKPDWLTTLKQDQRWLRPTPAAKNAFIHRQTANYSGDRDSQNLALNGTGALGLGERRYLGGNWAYTWNRVRDDNASRFWFDNLYARQDMGNHYYLQAGRMDQRNLSSPLGGNFAFTLLPLTRFDGLRIGTTEAYVNHSINRDATPVMIQVNRNARVDIYRGAQLLGSQYFAPGMHTLNSDSFPPGSYPLELRVYEDGVLQRKESQPFSKGGGTFSDQWQWFLQGGKASAERATSQQSTAQGTQAAGVQMALWRNLQLTSGLAKTQNTSYNETRLDAQHAFSFGVLSLAASGLTGSNGARGDSQQVSFADGFSASLYRYRVGGAGCDQTGNANNDIGCYTTLNGSLSVPLAGWSATLGYSDTKNNGRRNSRSASTDNLLPPPTLRSADQRNRAWQLGLARAFNWSGTTINTRLGTFRNSNGQTTDNGVYLGFTLSRVDNAAKSGGSDSYSSAGIDWRNGSGQSQTSYNLNHTRMWQQDTYRELALNFSGYNDDSYSGNLGGRANGRYGDLTGTLSDSQRRGGGSRTALTGGYSSAFALAGDGLFWGGNGGGEPAAGLAVRVAPAEENGAAAQISGGSYRPLTLGFGQSTLLPLDGYQLSNVTVQDIAGTSDGGVANVTGGAGEGRYFLPPGRLLVRDVRANITWVYIGQAIGPEGRALANAQVLNQALPALGADGGFTLQTQQKVPALWLISDGQLLRCPLQVKTVRDILQVVGETRCTVSGPEGLPQSLRMKPRVMKLLATAKR